MMKKTTLSRQRINTNVLVRRKNRKAQMLTPEQAEEEERRYQEQKTLANSVRFHSHLAAQLCFGGRDPAFPSLVKFDAGRCALEAAHPQETHPEEWLQIEMADIDRSTTDLHQQLRALFPNDPDFQLLSNESVAPVICPPVPIGRHKPLILNSLTVQRLEMLERLVKFDRVICDALLLNKFGLLPKDYYWQSVRWLRSRWVNVLKNTQALRPVFHGFFFFNAPARVQPDTVDAEAFPVPFNFFEKK